MYKRKYRIDIVDRSDNKDKLFCDITITSLPENKDYWEGLHIRLTKEDTTSLRDALSSEISEMGEK